MIDSNRSYCLRLADVAFPMLGSKPVSLALSEISDDVPAQCSRVAPPQSDRTLASELCWLFKVPTTPPPDWMSSAAALANALEGRPDIQAKLAVITEYTPSKWLLERELESAGLWKSVADPVTGAKPDAYAVARTRGATGLCLSGGGIRSATFNLGILQGLSRKKALGKLDYLSSVSGGGYIHQFLANWIYRAGSVTEVESLLDPIPNEPTFTYGSGATVQPEPLRWLRRYSNYLAPRKGLFSLDTWTIVATWIRNTALNLVVLLSALFFALLLPHLSAPPLLGEFLPHFRQLEWLQWVLAPLFLVVIVLLCYWLAHQQPPGPKPIYIKLACGTLLGAAIFVSPAIYSSSLPGGKSDCVSAQRVFQHGAERSDGHDNDVCEVKPASAQASAAKAESAQAAPVVRLRDHWSERPKPLLGNTRMKRFRVTLLLFSLLCAGLLFAVLLASRLNRLACAITFVCGIPFAYLLLEGVRLLFFVMCFTVPVDSIPSLGAALLPTLLYGVPFILMETGLGIVGNAADSGQREWMARLRAFSFLLGGSWLALISVSLLGPHLLDVLSGYAKTSYAVWSGWLLTTVGGLISAHSTNTSSTDSASPDTPGKSNLTLEILANIAPPVFVAGILVLISSFAQWALKVDQGTPHDDKVRFLILLLTSAFIALLFGWRVDVNDFSMHSFYRDRIARCYAGAVDRRRVANLFTGFTKADRSLRMHQLLPKGFQVFDEDSKPMCDADGKPITGTYAGPFPLFCTSINLTMGEDLAYQERKASSFAFSPLYSGYNVGWTSGSNPTNQFNGFVDTCGYVYAKTGSITTATASAISGAAASPNMGYHSNPAVAFLLTVFNVRLGWWILNPRRRSIGLTSRYPVPAKEDATWWQRLFRLHEGILPSSPRFGLLRLINELLGQSDDTTSFVYLTDGGHFDNMGLYELLRRRCRNIIVCDSESDASLQFEVIGMAIRKSRLDFGVEVTLDQIEPVQPKPAAVARTSMAADPNQPTDPAAPSAVALAQQTDNPAMVITAKISDESPAAVTGSVSQPEGPVMAGLSSFAQYPANKVHCVHGTIRYPEDTDPSQFGHILYIKSSLTGDEPPDLLNYRRQHQSFPFDTTLNQFFGETEFESYRRLGEHILLSDRTVSSWLKAYVEPHAAKE